MLTVILEHTEVLYTMELTHTLTSLTAELMDIIELTVNITLKVVDLIKEHGILTAI